MLNTQNISSKRRLSTLHSAKGGSNLDPRSYSSINRKLRRRSRLSTNKQIIYLQPYGYGKNKDQLGTSQELSSRDITHPANLTKNSRAIQSSFNIGISEKNSRQTFTLGDRTRKISHGGYGGRKLRKIDSEAFVGDDREPVRSLERTVGGIPIPERLRDRQSVRERHGKVTNNEFDRIKIKKRRNKRDSGYRYLWDASETDTGVQHPRGYNLIRNSLGGVMDQWKNNRVKKKSSGTGRIKDKFNIGDFKKKFDHKVSLASNREKKSLKEEHQTSRNLDRNTDTNEEKIENTFDMEPKMSSRGQRENSEGNKEGLSKFIQQQSNGLAIGKVHIPKDNPKKQAPEASDLIFDSMDPSGKRKSKASVGNAKLVNEKDNKRINDRQQTAEKKNHEEDIEQKVIEGTPEAPNPAILNQISPKFSASNFNFFKETNEHEEHVKPKLNLKTKPKITMNQINSYDVQKNRKSNKEENIEHQSPFKSRSRSIHNPGGMNLPSNANLQGVDNNPEQQQEKRQKTKSEIIESPKKAAKNTKINLGETTPPSSPARKKSSEENKEVPGYEYGLDFSAISQILASLKVGHLKPEERFRLIEQIQNSSGLSSGMVDTEMTQRKGISQFKDKADGDEKEDVGESRIAEDGVYLNFRDGYRVGEGQRLARMSEGLAVRTKEGGFVAARLNNTNTAL